MSKPANVDIQNLFHKFGGDPTSYQEIRREHEEDRAQLNWPIIAAMRNELPHAPQLKHASPAGSGTPHHLAARPRPASSLQDEIRNNLHAAPADTAPQNAPATASPLHSLFGSLETPGTQADMQTAPTHNQPPSDGSLNQLFSRLEGSSQPETDSASQNNLRSMLGRLKR